MARTYMFFNNVANKQYKNIKTAFVGNIIPNEWYKQFTNKRGSPDLSLISVLADIVYWYRPKKVKDNKTGYVTSINKFVGDAWQTSYEYFRRKFGFNREKVRRIFLRLENMGICSREFRSISLRGQTYNNRLFIHLSSHFFKSSIQQKETVQFKKNKANSNNDFLISRKVGGYPHFRGNNIDNKNNINKNRSINSSIEIESNLLKNLSENNEKTKQIYLYNSKINTQETHYPNISKAKLSIQAKKLREFYPLTEDDCNKLQSLSGRQFSINSMNEILLDMSTRLIHHSFTSKRSFLNYMGKAFFYEKRNPIKINNKNFRIRRNLQEQNGKEKEKYLFKKEDNNTYSLALECFLKKRLESKLKSQKAYRLLKAYKSIIIKDNTCFFYLLKDIKISNTEKSIILNQLNNFYHNYPQNNEKRIEKLKIIPPIEKSENKKSNSKKQEKKEFLSIGRWDKIRKKLIAIYGKATDNNWFSRLESHTDEDKKIITLIAPSKFIKYWIEQNYFYNIEKLINQEKFEVFLLSIQDKKYIVPS